MYNEICHGVYLYMEYIYVIEYLLWNTNFECKITFFLKDILRFFIRIVEIVDEHDHGDNCGSVGGDDDDAIATASKTSEGDVTSTKQLLKPLISNVSVYGRWCGVLVLNHVKLKEKSKVYSVRNDALNILSDFAIRKAST